MSELVGPNDNIRRVNVVAGRSRIISYQNQKTMPGATLVQRQITFRRASAAAIKVSIIPGPDHNSQEARRLQGYVKEGLESLTSDARYPRVCEQMGILGPGQPLESGQSRVI